MPNAPRKPNPPTINPPTETQVRVSHSQPHPSATRPADPSEMYSSATRPYLTTPSAAIAQAISPKFMPWRWMKPWIACLLIALVVTGCTLPSERTSFPEAVGSGATGDNATGGGTAPAENTVDAAELLEESLRAMEASEDAQRFWFRGHVKNSLALHAVTSMFDGVVSRPLDAVLVNGRIAAQPYQYYRNGNLTYMKVNDGWYRTSEETAPAPLDPFHGFRDWMPIIQEAVKRPDGDVFGVPTEVVEIRISGRDWVEHSPSILFDEMKQQLASLASGQSLEPSLQEEAQQITNLNDADHRNETQIQPQTIALNESLQSSLSANELRHLLDNAIVKMTLWIGKSDRFIYRYETWIVMPLPGGGHFDQQTNIAFFRYGDSTIDTQQIPSVEKVEHWADQFREHAKKRETEAEMLK